MKESIGINKLANVLNNRINRNMDTSLVLDFAEIQGNMSLLTNTFPIPIPKGEYSVLRSLTYGKEGEKLTETKVDGEHTNADGTMSNAHKHIVKIPEKMRSLKPGDRVLVAWVFSEAVVIDIVKRS